MDKNDFDIAKMGFDYAKDLAQQLITLSTGILALSITFMKEFTRDAQGPPAVIRSAWATFLASIFCGVWTLMALTGTLMQPAGQQQRLTFNSSLLPARLQILTFICGIVLILIYGARSLGGESQKVPGDASLGKD